MKKLKIERRTTSKRSKYQGQAKVRMSIQYPQLPLIAPNGPLLPPIAPNGPLLPPIAPNLPHSSKGASTTKVV